MFCHSQRERFDALLAFRADGDAQATRSAQIFTPLLTLSVRRSVCRLCDRENFVDIEV